MIETQKQIAREVLHKLEAIDPYCILAGGAPRDWKLGREASDLDFFLYVPHRPNWAVKKQLECLGLVVAQVKAGDNLPINYKLNPFLTCVYDIRYGVDVPIQVMVMNEPTFKSVVPTFALSICQAWWKGGDVQVTKDFLLSEKHRVIYKTNELYNNEHHYLEKILAKFPDYRYYQSKLEFLEHFLENTQ